jgi:periplasmic divalent cation tolerance protein
MSADPPPIAVYATFPDIATAEEICRDMVEAGLAACVNILPGMRSIYRWQDKIEEVDEVVAIMKTRRDLTSELVAGIESMHPYDTPAIVALQIVEGSDRYLNWIVSETSRVPVEE